VPLLQPKHTAGQPHAETAVGDGQQSPRALEAGQLRDRLGKLRRFAERRDAKHSSRSAVQNHPVVNALRGEELPPALLAHARLLYTKGIARASEGCIALRGAGGPMGRMGRRPAERIGVSDRKVEQTGELSADEFEQWTAPLRELQGRLV
jgi:hypothetical protein